MTEYSMQKRERMDSIASSVSVGNRSDRVLVRSLILGTPTFYTCPLLYEIHWVYNLGQSSQGQGWRPLWHSKWKTPWHFLSSKALLDTNFLKIEQLCPSRFQQMVSCYPRVWGSWLKSSISDTLPLFPLYRNLLRQKSPHWTVDLLGFLKLFADRFEIVTLLGNLFLSLFQIICI